MREKASRDSNSDLRPNVSSNSVRDNQSVKSFLVPGEYTIVSLNCDKNTIHRRNLGF